MRSGVEQRQHVSQGGRLAVAAPGGGVTVNMDIDPDADIIGLVTDVADVLGVNINIRTRPSAPATPSSSSEQQAASPTGKSA